MTSEERLRFKITEMMASGATPIKNLEDIAQFEGGNPLQARVEQLEKDNAKLKADIGH